ncbi:MAG: hypothetical protein ACUVTF_10095 [bacterium]
MKIKMMKFNKWFTRVPLICFLALVYIGGYCEKQRPENPNLKFLIGDTLNHSFHCSHPVVSPEGNVIYYLRANSDSVRFDELTFGSIYSINVDGTENKEVLYGKYNALAISPDGKRLAVHPLTGSHSALQPESLILIFHLSDAKIDTYPAVKRWIMDTEFAADTQWLIYIVWQDPIEIYRLNLSDSTSELIQSVAWAGGFDLFNNDSLYFDSSMAYPQVNPVYEKYVIGTPGFENLVFTLRNTETNKLDSLAGSLIPYNGPVGYPYWFPNGKDIVFMAKPYNEPADEIAGEIWMLTNFFDQVDTTVLR